MLLVARFLQRQGRQALQTVEESASPGVTEPNFVTAALVADDAPGDGILESSASVESPISPLPTNDAEAAPLPYDGDMQAAMKAQDRAAIRILMAARVEHKPHNAAPSDCSPTQVDATAAPAQTRRVRPQPPPPLPRATVRTWLPSMAGAAERFMVRHRTSSALIFAYCSFFYRLYDEAGKLGAVGPGPVATELATGTMMLDPEAGMPLTRASVLARVRVADHGRRAGAGLRREGAGKPDEKVSEDDDPMTLLEGALGVAASEKEPKRRAHLLAESYTALGNIHSARGHYYEMLHAMSLALRASADSGDNEAVSNLQVALGHLELKHHRYYAAGTRFEDALQTSAGANISNATRVEALAGLGWAALVQGSGEVAGGRFLEALAWAPPSKLSVSVAVSIAVAAARREGCRVRLDGLDAPRALSLAGLGLMSARAANGAIIRDGDGDGAMDGRRSSAILLDCAVSLFQGLSAPLQDPRTWGVLGLARHTLHEMAAAKRYHQRAALRERRDSALVMAIPGDSTCATAADLPACSHNALHLGLADFGAGNAPLGMRHVDVLLSRTSEIAVEAAEWLTRFARAHAWAPAGHDFAAFLLGRVEPLLKGEGEARMAKHFVDHGRFLLAGESPARFKRALSQLGRARVIVERVDIGWTDSEVAQLYSTMGSVQHQVGQVEEAVLSFENSLKFDRQSAAASARPNHKRLLLSHANLGAARLQLAGTNPQRWRVALKDMNDGRQAAHKAGLSLLDPIMKELEDSYRNAMRLAHRRGMLATCPGPLAAFLYGPSCPSDAEVER